MQWTPKATVLAQGLCLAGLELDPCLGAGAVALPAVTHPPVPAPQPPRLWELVLPVGKPLQGGALALPHPVRPKARAGGTQVLKLLLASPGCWPRGRREPLCRVAPSRSPR